MRQPRSLFLLFFVEMWERFSYYGMRVLLVLYMIERLHLSDFQAFGVYALYTALVEMGAIAGGYFADRIFGLRPSIILGGSLIALGHLSLTFESGTHLFFLGLALIITGSTLFISNIKALLGLFYEKNDARREAGFTLFYTGINVGGFMATLLCGWVGQTFGWHLGFGLAAGGMLLGLGVLVGMKHLLEGKGEAPAGVSLLKKGTFVFGIFCAPIGLAYFLKTPALLTPFLPLVGVGTLCYIALKLRNFSPEVKREVRALVGLIALLVLYFTFEELMGSLLMVFCERHVDRAVATLTIPSSVLMAINPLTVILFGALLAKFRGRKGQVSGVDGVRRNCSLAFLILGGAFAFLTGGGLLAHVTGLVPVGFVGVSFFLIAFGELFLAPPIFSYCSEVAPREMKGVLMALVIMGFSYASLISGSLGQLVARVQEISTHGEGVGIYTLFFAAAAGGCALVGGGLWILSFIKRRLYQT